ncbi:copper resistance CopC family protein [Micromonospora sp. NPDC049204]|uniref:copper resistance CopC family protein n=1 Tax=Micromonospora sp. NPDC049204 TaxID=3154351 RepID=UPI0033CD8023
MARVVPVVLGVAFGVSFLVPAAPAAAHNSLTGSDPRDGARVATAPARIELRFLATPAPATTKITITGPDNVVAGGPPVFAGKRVRVPFTPAAAGLYVVGYQLASSDGHPVKGEVRFTLTTGASASPSALPAADGGTAVPPGATVGSPSGGPASATQGVIPTVVAPLYKERDNSAARLWFGALGALVLLAALVSGLLIRRRATRR